ncbi:putative membrane protein [Sorangium cellulosum So ce56]|jgi:hypothetical protein|uniref:Membrane protein n=1 Tax=Sorangium cellulosum (strain So ce56) TaxID=448385 RepID=A9GBG8_SORC5|nr:putative membrane protein [Sorangium cellulosum So ce56]
MSTEISKTDNDDWTMPKLIALAFTTLLVAFSVIYLISP